MMGMSQYDAGIYAGYSDGYMRHHSIDVEKRVKTSIIDELNRAGGTDKVMAQQLIDTALFATKIQNCTLLVQQGPDGKLKINRNSDDFIEIPDRFLKLKTWELIAKLKKQLSDQPIIDQSDHTHLTIIVQKEEDVPGSEIQADEKTESRVPATY
jgi:hypothetical protein